MFHYYIYYQVNPERLLEADAAVKQIQYEMEAHFSIAGRLLKKRDEPMLWMEVYENVPSSTAFEAALKQVEDKTGIMQYMLGDGQRHLECFVD
ncbi:MAG: DUF4936 family protein [Burkholderiales bacterium]|nr:DUF4936 family protein [Burkholderiales bacterium]